MVKMKVSAEGLDPTFMDKTPDELVKVDGPASDKPDSSGMYVCMYVCMYICIVHLNFLCVYSLSNN